MLATFHCVTTSSGVTHSSFDDNKTCVSGVPSGLLPNSSITAQNSYSNVAIHLELNPAQYKNIV